MICVRQTGRGQGTRVPTKHGETVRDQDTRTPCPCQCFCLAISEMSILVTTYYVWGDLRADPQNPLGMFSHMHLECFRPRNRQPQEGVTLRLGSVCVRPQRALSTWTWP